MFRIVNAAALEARELRSRRFTDDAIQVLRQTVERSLARPLVGLVPQLAVLWSMLRWERKLGVRVLEECGVSLDAMEADVGDALGQWSRDHSTGDIDFCEVSEVARFAKEEACSLNRDYVGTEHLVLALCRGSDARLADILAKYSITADTVKMAIAELTRCS